VGNGAHSGKRRRENPLGFICFAWAGGIWGIWLTRFIRAFCPTGIGRRAADVLSDVIYWTPACAKAGAW